MRAKCSRMENATATSSYHCPDPRGPECDGRTGTCACPGIRVLTGRRSSPKRSTLQPSIPCRRSGNLHVLCSRGLNGHGRAEWQSRLCFAAGQAGQHARMHIAFFSGGHACGSRAETPARGATVVECDIPDRVVGCPASPTACSPTYRKIGWMSMSGVPGSQGKQGFCPVDDPARLVGDIVLHGTRWPQLFEPSLCTHALREP
jgi:hypothetical protein